jgi:hypothetical protein
MRASPVARLSPLLLARRILRGAAGAHAPAPTPSTTGTPSADQAATAEVAAGAARSTRRAHRAIAPAAADARFRCNLCGAQCRVPRASLGREIASCPHCASTVRFRAIAHLVVRELLGTDAPLCDLARHGDIRGVGLSDDDRYAHAVERAFD